LVLAIGDHHNPYFASVAIGCLCGDNIFEKPWLGGRLWVIQHEPEFQNMQDVTHDKAAIPHLIYGVQLEAEVQPIASRCLIDLLGGHCD
jgi:hypothetical protein